MIAEKFYVYILQSKKDYSFYVGQTDDLEVRVARHNDGGSKYTSSKKPWELVYFETYGTRVLAMKREKEIKLKKSRIYIENLVSRKLF